MTILSAPHQITTDLLTQILRKAEVIRSATVTALSYEPIGIGLMGDTMRFHIEYDRMETGAPRSIAGKFPTADPVARSNGAQIGIYLTETRFYQQIAHTLNVAAPRCYYAEIEPSTSEFALLLEDVGQARTPDQLVGCSRSDAQLALAQAAALHAPRFGDESVWHIDWMKVRYQVYGTVCSNFASYIDTFRNRYADMLAPEYMRLCEAFADVVAEFAIKQPKRFSLIHGDFRLDNMLFDAQNGQKPIVILDWQSIAPENPAMDVAYFIGTSYPIDLRSRDERDLMRYYHEQMMVRGVTDYSWDAIWDDYRRGAWLGLLTAIFASAVSKQTERGDQMFMRMVRGSANQMMEHDTLSFA